MLSSAESTNVTDVATEKIYTSVLCLEKPFSSCVPSASRNSHICCRNFRGIWDVSHLCQGQHLEQTCKISPILLYWCCGGRWQGQEVQYILCKVLVLSFLNGRWQCYRVMKLMWGFKNTLKKKQKYQHITNVSIDLGNFFFSFFLYVCMFTGLQ